MRFGSFVFPVSQDPINDHRIINETLEEIILCDELGFDTIWLTEHHFDGATAYVDPVVFAAAVAAKTKRVRIGFAVVEMALHHPVRLAAQTALLDNLSNGRIIVGTGRGSAFNEYEYIGFGVPMAESANSLKEAEALILEAWQGNPVDFKGKYWEVSFPGLRPLPIQKPNPPLIRACLSVESTRAMAKMRRPVLIGAQDNESIAERLNVYRDEVIATGATDEELESLLDQIWVSKNVLVGDSESETIQIARDGLETEQSHFWKARDLFNPPDRAIKRQPNSNNFDATFIAGTPEKVSGYIHELEEIGVRNLMMKFNTGEMNQNCVKRSIDLFTREIMPQFNKK